MNPGLCSEKPATNYLKYGTASTNNSLICDFTMAPGWYKRKKEKK
jgi:hypothetical protein